MNQWINNFRLSLHYSLLITHYSLLDMIMRPYILLNPGPVNVSPRVQQALLRGDLCHREEEFSDLLAAVRGKLLRAFASRGYTAVPLSGSGTLAVEAVVSSALPEGRKLLVINNGVYGER